MDAGPNAGAENADDVRGVLGRWAEAGARLGLPACAVSACGVVLAAELTGRSLTRGEVLAAVAEQHKAGAARAGLAAAELRGVVVAVEDEGPWATQALRVNGRVRAFCLGVEDVGPCEAPPADAVLPRVAQEVAAIAQRAAGSPARYAVVVRGRRGAGRDGVVALLASKLGVGVLRRAPAEIGSESDGLQPELSGAIAVWDGRGIDASPAELVRASQWLGRSASVAVALLDVAQDAPAVEGRVVLEVRADARDLSERETAWTLALGSRGAANAKRLARTTRAGLGLARRAALAVGEGDVEAYLAETVAPSQLRGVVVERVDVGLDAVVASDETRLALERVVLLARWAPDVASPGRLGAKALFSGPSGVGKTLAARGIAHALRRPLYRVDLATVVSKWVGETEKNLRHAFDAAEDVGAVLLFDEGDALFGKRGEVGRGSDRYANMEVSYLLQAIESFDGTLVVTTNRRGDLDKAFERRFDVAIDFAPPGEALRVAIWRQELGEVGAELPEFFYRRLGQAELTGGNIASAARLARVYALDAGEARLSAAVVQRAVRAEFLKLGSLVHANGWSEEQSELDFEEGEARWAR